MGPVPDHGRHFDPDSDTVLLLLADLSVSLEIAAPLKRNQAQPVKGGGVGEGMSLGVSTAGQYGQLWTALETLGTLATDRFTAGIL